MATLAEIRAKLQEQEVKRSKIIRRRQRNLSRNIEGTTATLRFLSTKIPNNTFLLG